LVSLPLSTFIVRTGIEEKVVFVVVYLPVFARYPECLT